MGRAKLSYFDYQRRGIVRLRPGKLAKVLVVDVFIQKIKAFVHFHLMNM
jgi:hypothetical protein